MGHNSLAARWNAALALVNCAGFEPATSALSRQRSKPAELTIQFRIANIRTSNQFNQSLLNIFCLASPVSFFAFCLACLEKAIFSSNFVINDHASSYVLIRLISP